MTRAGDDKVLILFRHAKAEQGFGKADHDRELTGRGLRDAQAAGAWLHEHQLGPELVLCSTARRTRQTWDAAVAGGACGEAVEYVEDVYAGGTGRVLEVLREKADGAQVVLVVGHNPTMAMLASGLTEGNGSTAAHDCLAQGFPTSSLAVLRYEGGWDGLGIATARLERCHVARG
jgi:phosphohistidine phosphatase